MGLNLSTDDIMALEARTEGWIAGLQLAALTMRGREDAGALIRSFTGSHRFVLDYLMEEVLTQQSPSVQTFLLRTAILDRLSGPLAETVVGGEQPAGQSTLEYLERANLFIVPLDDERRWYRYHHLFAELLRQRLQQSAGEQEIATLHRRASQWFEEHGLELEAFHHAVAANDIERAERLIAAKGAPLYTRGAATPVLNWLDALPPAVLDARPWLWVMAATALAIVGRMSQVELKLQAAEAVIDTVASEERRHDLIGRIADLRALLGLMAADPHHLQAIIAQSHHAPEDFHPDNLTIGPSALWKLGLAHLRTGNRAEAGPIFTDAIAASEASGNIHVNILATTSLGRVLEHANELHRAAETYQHALQLVGNPPGPIACEAHAGLARITYEWNDLDAAHRHGRLSVELARQLEIASFVPGEVLLARLQLAQRDPTGALAALERTAQEIRECGFLFRLPEVADAQVPALIALDRLADAERLARTVSLPLGLARVQLAQRDAPAALATLAAYRRDVEARGWPDEALRTMTLQAIAHSLNGDDAQALSFLTEALVLAAPGGHIRLFVDEGLPMARLLSAANERGDQPDYLTRLLAAFADEGMPTTTRPRQPLVEPLSERELEILRLISQGLSNQQIGERLFIALSTVKGHNRNIFGKLQVQRRTEAIARARELDLL
jgi:LuxR family maltose regulon positive regulatory protein